MDNDTKLIFKTKTKQGIWFRILAIRDDHITPEELFGTDEVTDVMLMACMMEGVWIFRLEEFDHQDNGDWEQVDFRDGFLGLKDIHNNRDHYVIEYFKQYIKQTEQESTKDLGVLKC